MPKRVPAPQAALTRAVNKAIAEGAPVYVDKNRVRLDQYVAECFKDNERKRDPIQPCK